MYYFPLEIFHNLLCISKSRSVSARYFNRNNNDNANITLCPIGYYTFEFYFFFQSDNFIQVKLPTETHV